jgi:hypothetical protein
LTASRFITNHLTSSRKEYCVPTMLKQKFSDVYIAAVMNLQCEIMNK